MAKKKAVLISGGGSWGAYGGGTLARLNKDYNTVVGISTGAIMSPLVALNEWDHLKIAYTTINNKGIFDKKWYKPYPITKKGKFNKLAILISLILGEKTVGTTNNLKKRIDENFVKFYYDKINYLNKEIYIGTQNFAQLPSKIHYFSNLNSDFEDLKDWIWSSANIPFFGSLMKKRWYDSNDKFHIGLWTDGGLSDLVGFDILNKSYYKEIDIILNKTNLLSKYEGRKINNLMDNMIAGISAMQYNTDFKFFKEKINELNSKGITVNVYRIPRELETNSLVFNEKQMLKWWEEGYETAFDSNRVEIFKPKKSQR